jgi:UDP-N-acetylmuramoylalanine--D-glutamate ligase
MIQKNTGRVLVLGMGASGMAAARLLSKRGWLVMIADERADGAQLVSTLASQGVTAECVRNVTSIARGVFDAVVVSPGIPSQHVWLEHARSLSVPIIPEFELGVSMMPSARIVAVTGSNGKSSLVKWISDALNLAGIRAIPAGNYGLPPSEIALSGKSPEVIVLELSSFQLEQSVSFKPDIAVLLNLTPNHLDRHPTFELYARAKVRMFAHMSSRDRVIIHAPAWEIVGGMVSSDIQPVIFDTGTCPAYGFTDGIVYRHGEPAVNLNSTLWGRSPMGVNAAAGVAVLDALGVSPGLIEQSAAAFVPLPHRLELVATHKGVRFVNDSKASTLAALAAAVSSGSEKKHLIAGGILKESNVNFVKEILAKHGAFVYCIGQVAQKLVEAWQDVVPCENCGDLGTAVAKAFRSAKKDEVVLLSPGCSSFDQFASYAQRGEKFKQLVQECISQNGKVEITMQGVRS